MRFESLLLGILLLANTAHAREDAHPYYGQHHGYTFAVKEEKDRHDVEMVMLDPPPPLKEKPTVIVNEKLSREFQQQYEYRFGRTKTEQVLNSPSREDSYTYFTGENLTITDYMRYQRQFAEYMGRRLTEYHVDNFVKTDPTLRPVYELKDRVGRLDVTVKKGYNVRWRYNFAGPSMDVTIENPYDIDFRLRMEMGGIVSSPNEYIWTASYPLTTRVTVSALHKQTDGLSQIVFARKINSHVSTTLTGSIDALPAGPTVQQNLILVGLTWSE